MDLSPTPELAKKMINGRMPAGHWIVISGFFLKEISVRQALSSLLSLGIPRDLIEILISKKDEDRFFLVSRRRKPAYGVANAGRGALIGLIVFSLISAFLIVVSRGDDSRRLTWLMLLGPNVGVLLGALGGLIWGFVRPTFIPQRYERLRERKGILFVVRTKRESQVKSIQKRLEEQGGESVEVGYI